MTSLSRKGFVYSPFQAILRSLFQLVHNVFPPFTVLRLDKDLYGHCMLFKTVAGLVPDKDLYGHCMLFKTVAGLVPDKDLY